MISDAPRMDDGAPPQQSLMDDTPQQQPGGASERRVWSADEDVQIVALVSEHGTRAWSVIAAQLPTRTGKQCRERWHNQLDPNITKTDWSAEEDELLIASHGRFGNKWAEIAKQLAGRTDSEAVHELGIDRRLDPVIAIGGGVCMDIVGFAASIYRRRTPYIRVPTTLMGYVDASVGAKSGVNFH